MFACVEDSIVCQQHDYNHILYPDFDVSACDRCFSPNLVVANFDLYSEQHIGPFRMESLKNMGAFVYSFTSTYSTQCCT